MSGELSHAGFPARAPTGRRLAPAFVQGLFLVEREDKVLIPTRERSVSHHPKMDNYVNKVTRAIAPRNI